MILTEKKHFIRRFCARLIDYILVYSLVTELYSLFGIWLEFSEEILIGAFTPMIFFPIEAVCLYFFQTTLGKGLFQLSVERPNGEKPTRLECVRYSFYEALKINSIILLVGEYILSKFIFKQQLPPTLVVVKKPKGFAFVGLYLGTAFLCLVGPQVYEQVKTSTPTSLISQIEGDFSSWQPFSLPNLNSKVAFPGAPTTVEKSLRLPKGVRSLTYTEFVYTDALSSSTFSIGHTKLPKSILKWSSGLVLKGSLDIIKENEKGAKVVKREVSKIGKIPCLNYKMQKDGTLYTGRLLLVDDTLYKIDAVHSKENSSTLENSIQYFLDSFEIQ